MTQMALHDKRYGDADRAAFSFFRRDYIYRKNVGTRTGVFIGAMILLGLYWLRQIFILGTDIQTIDVQQSVLDSLLFVLFMLSVYTLIGTIQGTHQYHRIQKRMERYLSMMEQAENLPDTPEPLDEATTPLYSESESEARSDARSRGRNEAHGEARGGVRNETRSTARSGTRNSTPPVRSTPPRTPPRTTSRTTSPRPATRPTAPRAMSRPGRPPTRRT